MSQMLVITDQLFEGLGLDQATGTRNDRHEAVAQIRGPRRRLETKYEETPDSTGPHPGGSFPLIGHLVVDSSVVIKSYSRPARSGAAPADPEAAEHTVDF